MKAQECVHGEVRSWRWVSSLYHSPLRFESGHFIEHGTSSSSRLAGQKRPGVFLSLLPQCWDSLCDLLSPALLHGLWREASGPMPVQQHFTNSAESRKCITDKQKYSSPKNIPTAICAIEKIVYQI